MDVVGRALRPADVPADVGPGTVDPRLLDLSARDGVQARPSGRIVLTGVAAPDRNGGIVMYAADKAYASAPAHARFHDGGSRSALREVR